MGTEGLSGQQFMREVYASPQLPVDVSGINDKDLDLFTRDSPFNLSLKQALECLENPSALAEVT